MKKQPLVFSLLTLGAAVCAAGIYVGETDDAPGAALIGILFLVGACVASIKIARRRA